MKKKNFLSFYNKFAVQGGLYHDYLQHHDYNLPNLEDNSLASLEQMFTSLKDTSVKLKVRYQEIKFSEGLIEQAEKLLLEKFFLDVNWLINDLDEYFIRTGNNDFILKNVNEGNIDELDINGRSILMRATDCDNIDLALALLDKGANPFLKCNLSETPFSVAIDKGYIDLAKCYISKQAEDNKELNDITKVESEEEFYASLAHHLNSFGFDEGSFNVCRSYIQDNYEALGMDSDNLLWG